MNAALRKRWIEALRSDEYKQGFTQLKTPKGEYCCLGVLCDIVHKQAPEHSSWSHRNRFIYDEDERTSYIPLFLAERLGLKDIQGKLSMMNDTGSTFDEIAKYIEDNIPAE